MKQKWPILIFSALLTAFIVLAGIWGNAQFERLHSGSGQTGIACTIYVRAKAAAEALSRLFQSRGRVRMDSQQRLCAPALPLGLSPPLGRKQRHSGRQPPLRRTVQAQHTAGLLCQIPSTPHF